MSQSVNIPSPDDSGSDGNQKNADMASTLVESNTWNGLQIARTIEGLATTHARSFGSEVTTALIAGATTQLASELNEAKRTVKQLLIEKDTLKDELSDVNIRKAVLEERINSYRSNRHLKNLGIVVGTTLLAISFKLFTLDRDGFGYLSLATGTLLLIFGWISAPKGGDK